MTTGTRWIGTIVSALLVAVAADVRAQTESIEAHRKHEQHSVMISTEGIPAPVTLAGGEVLGFHNHSMRPLIVTFTKPENVKDKVHCGIIRSTPEAESQAPWQLFAWDGGQLTAVIPPGRFATLCAFEPGEYTYTVREAGASAPKPRTGKVVVKS